MDRMISAERIRDKVHTWNTLKVDAAKMAATKGMTVFTDLHNTQTRELVSLIGQERSAEWWESLSELAVNAASMIRSGTLTGAVRVLDPADIQHRKELHSPGGLARVSLPGN